MSNILSPLPYGDSQYEQPQYQPSVNIEPLPPAPVRNHRLLRNIGVLAAGVGAAGGLYAGAYEVADAYFGHATAYELTADDQYRLNHTTDVEPSTLRGPDARVDRDIRQALSVDTCDTKVSPEDVMGEYQRLFGAESAPSDNPKVLQSQVAEVTDRIHQNEARLDFAEFPADDYQRLMQDANSDDPSIPLEEYHKVLDSYVGQLGLTTLYQWDTKAVGAPNSDMIKPVDNLAAHTDVMARRAMVDAIGGLSFMSRDLIAASGGRRLVFGDITKKDALGEVIMDGSDIYVDTLMYGNDQRKDLNDQTGIMSVVAPHETTHLLHDRLCWQLLNKYAGEDNAMRSLNGGIAYKDDAKKDKNKIVTMALDETGATKVVSVRSYGTENSMEDTATIGEAAFYGPNALRLYTHDTNKGQDLTPMREKVALLLARVGKMNPQLARYYTDILQAGRLQAHAISKINPLVDQLNAMYNANPGLLKRPSHNHTLQKYNQIAAVYSQYDTVERDLEANLAVGSSSVRK